ncbi:hypothetical protein Pst134EA_032749 [Puccinia striiformis f. sp. tritici]|uniref:uncharacterized protein n=1 Tax=Puccinia striiformis f. sp. tritici TaxID=168172 RepID=UPI0020083325|nr:uncharacterized protein Pst134EA_032749 [Puccinia striiformis f. sp. tritici]KAH9441623.1 hypothetical protein Pst134EA_032749 [Puccinia striiformis f. sp. tritici]
MGTYGIRRNPFNVQSEGQLVGNSGIPRYFHFSKSSKPLKGKILEFQSGDGGKWPFVLCLVPTLCGLPQLVLILVSYLQVGKAWIFHQYFSFASISHRQQAHSPSSVVYHQMQVDITGKFLQSGIGGYVVLSASLVACLGLNGLQITNTGLPATLSNHISTKYRQSSKSKRAADGSWSPPKPSYNRSHRLVSMSSVADSDIYERETSSARVRLASYRDPPITLPQPAEKLPCGIGQVSVAKPVLRQDVGGLENSSGRPRHSAKPLRGKDEVFVPLIIRIVANILPIHQWSLELLGTPPLSQKTEQDRKLEVPVL